MSRRRSSSSTRRRRPLRSRTRGGASDRPRPPPRDRPGTARRGASAARAAPGLPLAPAASSRRAAGRRRRGGLPAWVAGRRATQRQRAERRGNRASGWWRRGTWVDSGRGRVVGPQHTPLGEASQAADFAPPSWIPGAGSVLIVLERELELHLRARPSSPPQAQWPRLRDKQEHPSGSQERDVLLEVGHVHLADGGIGGRPVIVHQERRRHEEGGQQQDSPGGADAQENAQAAQDDERSRAEYGQPRGRNPFG